MSMSTDRSYNQHIVCTPDEARAIVDGHKKFWIANCRCRENRGNCKRSGIEVCLQFASRTAVGSVGSNFRAITKDDALALIEEAQGDHLVPRPFRNDNNKNKLDGICFCCDDCCTYFLGEDVACDKGKLIESTDMSVCIDCGVCTGVCYFGARNAEEGLKVDREKCYGCGLCVDVCAMKAISMVSR
jgi:ferredoxin